MGPECDLHKLSCSGILAPVVVKAMNVQNANNELNKLEKVKKIFLCIAFGIAALFWFFEMICGLSLWLEGAHHRSLGGTELIRVSIAEKVLDIACFPSICL